MEKIDRRTLKETVEKTNLKKVKTFKSKLDFDKLEQFLDVEIKKSNKYKNITLRIFKEEIEKGKSLRDMINDGYNNRHVYFFSYICQCKNLISKDVFEQEYNSGLGLNGIRIKYNIPYDMVKPLKNFYKVKTKMKKGFKKKKSRKHSVILTDRQKEILYGSMMGDAKRIGSASGNRSCAGFGQSEKQKDYLFWKFEEFKNTTNGKLPKECIGYNKNLKKNIISWRFNTYANYDIEECNNLFYKTGSKQVCNEILEKLTPLSIAVWYMDDGRVIFKNSGTIDKPVLDEPMLCTDSFTIEGCEKIVNWFQNKYGIKTHIRIRYNENKTKQYPRIIINSIDRQKFIDLIKPYFIPSMLYKIDQEAYLIWRKNKDEKEELEKGNNVI